MIATDLPRLAPQNLDAERGVLGAILLDQAVLAAVRDSLSASDFYRSAHGTVFMAMLALADRGEAIDTIMVASELESRKHLSAVGGRAALAELLLAVPSASNIKSHTQIVREHAQRRATIRAAEAVLEQAHAGADLETIHETLVALDAAIPSPATTTQPPPAPDPWPALNEAAYHGLAGEVVRLLEPHTEADPVALLASFLAEVGAMLNRAPHLILDGTYHPLLFWPVLVGQSSKSRKGTAGKRIQTLLSLADPAWTRGECRGTLSSGEGLAFAVRDAQHREEPLKEKGRPTGETVTICVDPGVSDKRLFLAQPEFGAVLRVMARDGNSLSGALRDAWDGLTLAPMTKANRIRATDPHIGIVGHVTKDELLRNLTDTEASNGFANRFVWLAVRRSKELPFPSAPDEAAMTALAVRIGRIIQHGRTIGLIGMADQARDGWRAIYHDLSADRPGLAGALLARGEAQVRRLAALYAILDAQSAIDLAHLRAALALWEFAEASTRLIFGDSIGDPVADTILRG